MLAQGLMPRLSAGLTAAGLAYTPRFVPAEDESVDDEIALDLCGAPTGLSIQIGDSYAGLNEALTKDGKFEGVKCLAFFDDPLPDAVVPVVVDLLRRRM